MKAKLFLLAALFSALCPLALNASEYTKYLFVYFPSNDNENIYYALSDKDDPFNFVPMNDGKMVVSADTISLKKGVRDPHVLRGEDGWFYMVNTDMRCAEGWDSNRGMVLMRSKDLVNWQHATVHFPEKYKGTNFANVTRVWAPETIWDPQAGKYLVYFSLLTNDGTIPYDKVYYCYANKDFTDLEGEPTYFYDRGSATIDMDIVYNDKDQLYHAFYKNEGEGGICKVTASTLTPAAGKPDGSQWSEPSGKLQQTEVAVEGAGVWKMIGSDTWILMYDCYGSGYYQFCESTDLSKFTLKAQTMTSGMFTPRHGTVLPVTDAEVETINRLLAEQRRGEVVSMLKTEVNIANELGVDVQAAEALLEKGSVQEMEAEIDNLKVKEYSAVMANFTEDVTSLMGAYRQVNVRADMSGQHWDGTGTSTYYEQNWGWAASAWTMSMTATATLPAGKYVLKAACRSASDAVNATIGVDDKKVNFPHKGDKGYGIALDGTACFDATAKYANGGAGRGWEWRYVPFEVSKDGKVTIEISSSVEDKYFQWMSVTNITLLKAKNLSNVKGMKAQKHQKKQAFDLGGREVRNSSAIKTTSVSVVGEKKFIGK